MHSAYRLYLGELTCAQCLQVVQEVYHSLRFACTGLICGLCKWLLGEVVERKFPTHVSCKLCVVSVHMHQYAYTQTPYMDMPSVHVYAHTHEYAYS